MAAPVGSSHRSGQRPERVLGQRQPPAAAGLDLERQIVFARVLTALLVGLQVAALRGDHPQIELGTQPT